MLTSTRLQRIPTILALLLALQLIACAADEGGGGSCPNDLPSECPDPEPVYGDEVAPILVERCVPCHGPGGPQSALDFSTYAGVSRQSDRILRQVYSCRMPPDGAVPLEPEERQTVLGWLVCGAKDD